MLHSSDPTLVRWPEIGQRRRRMRKALPNKERSAADGSGIYVICMPFRIQFVAAPDSTVKVSSPKEFGARPLMAAVPPLPPRLVLAGSIWTVFPLAVKLVRRVPVRLT